MKIGYFVGHFPYKDLLNDPSACQYLKRYNHDGGVDAAYNLAINMANRGHDVKVFTTSLDKMDSEENYGNVKVYRYGTNFRFETINISINILRKIEADDLDIIHVHCVHPMAEIAALLKVRKRNIPFVLTYHGDPQECFGSLARRIAVNLYIKMLLNKVLWRSHAIISPSQYFIGNSKYLDKFLYKIFVIPNGVNVQAFRIPQSKEWCKRKLGLFHPTILFVARLDQRKGPDILIRSLINIVKDVPDVELIMVGEGPLRSELMTLANDLGLSSHIRFEGFVGEQEKPIYYKSADVFVLPSTMNSEIFGIVNLEAMSSGIPIVASKVGGVPDVVEDGVVGLLVPPSDTLALSDAVTKILTNPSLKEELSKNGQQRSEDYSWEKIAEDVERVYKGLL